MENHPDNKSIQNFVDWQSVSKHNGWLVYKAKLQDLIEEYSAYMDNINASAETLKNYQLIKKGLQMAYNIPRMLEIKAKTVRKNKTPSRIDNFFRVGK